MANKNKGDVCVANESGSCEIKGENYVFIKGVTRVRAGHPLLKAVPDYFESIHEHVHYDVEQATAAPGEKRGRRGRQKAAPVEAAVAAPGKKQK